MGIATDNLGLLIAEQNSHVIRRLWANGTLATHAGTGGSSGLTGDGGPVSAGVKFNAPAAVTVDLSGGVYVMDTNNHVVRFIAPNATIWRVAGTGLSGSGGNGGPATLATLNLPVAGVLDGAGGLFVLEKGNCVVRRIFANGSIALVVGTGVCATTAIGDGGPASLARLQSPTGLLDDGAGGLLIADTGNCEIRRYNSLTGSITVSAGLGASSCGMQGNGVPAITASVRNPPSLGSDGAGGYYFPDQTLNIVRQVDAAGIVSTVAGTTSAYQGLVGNGGPGTLARMSLPVSVISDGAGGVIFCDQFNSYVRRFRANDTVVTTFMGSGTSAYPGDGLPQTSIGFSFVTSIASDGAGGYLVTDQNKGAVRRAYANGSVYAFAGNGTPGFSGDGGPAVRATMRSIYGVSQPDAIGTVFIADTGNAVVRAVNAALVISTVAGNGTSGYFGDGGPATLAMLMQPRAVLSDGAGGVIFSDQSLFCIRRAFSNGTIATIVGLCSAGGVSGDGGPASLARSGTVNGLAS